MSQTEGVTRDEGQAEPVWVEVTEGPSAGQKVRLDRGTVFVGSGEGVDVQLDDRAVSRRHLSLELFGSKVRVRDLGSRNGTQYLGAAIAEALVPLGASLTLGRSTLTVRAIAERDVEPSAKTELAGLTGRSVAMRRVFTRLEKLAASEATVLFVGESGTGKEAAARALHALSPRRLAPFVVFECAAANPQLLESQLFGHVRGAFTGAERDQPGLVESALEGTLLLDEVGALPLELQPRLLRLLEAREFRRVGDTRPRPTKARLVASTQRDLSRAVREGSFREDLYYRLAVSVVALPPLRERRDDIAPLVAHFSRQLRGVDVACSRATLEALQLEAWPGNARELRNAVTRALALGEWKASAPGEETPATFQEARQKVLDAFERDYLEALLKKNEGNVSKAAREAGLARSAFYRLLDRHQLPGH
jgi:DNA-binding NtrC family response regulator